MATNQKMLLHLTRSFYMTVQWYAASNRFTAISLNNEDSGNRCMWITNGWYVNWETTTEVQEEPNPVPLTYSSTKVMGMKPSAAYDQFYSLKRHWSLTCNHTCASDLATVYRFLCFTCSRLLIRSIAAKLKHMPQWDTLHCDSYIHKAGVRMCTS